MKKLFAVLLCAMAFNYAVMGQVLEVISVEKIELPKEAIGNRVQISPDGTSVAVTDNHYRGLQVFNLNSNKLTTISTANGAGYGVEFDANTSAVNYQELSLAKDNGVIAKKQTHNLTTGKAVKARRLIANDRPEVSYEDAQIALTSADGTKRIVSPNGAMPHMYVWATVSPNGKHLCFFDSFENATFISDIDGSNVKKLDGVLHDAKWLNDNVIVAMRDFDDGVRYTKSAIVVKNITDNAEQILTPDSQMAMYPSATAVGDKIAYHTLEGEAYIINVK